MQEGNLIIRGTDCDGTTDGRHHYEDRGNYLWCRVCGKTGSATVKLTLPYPISANRYWRTRVILPRGGKTPFASTYVSGEATEYKNTIRMICIKNKVRKLAGELQLTLKLYRPYRRGDLDNRIKVCLDSLTGFAYDDDDQIIRIVAERFDDKSNPRAEVEIEVLKPAVEQLSLIDPIKGQKHKKPTEVVA